MPEMRTLHYSGQFHIPQGVHDREVNYTRKTNYKQAGRITRACPSEQARALGIQCNPSGVTPKNHPNKWRLIVDLSRPNKRRLTVELSRPNKWRLTVYLSRSKNEGS